VEPVSEAARRDERSHAAQDEADERTRARQHGPAVAAIEPGSALSATAALLLQRSAGNAAVVDLVRAERRESRAIESALDGKAAGAVVQRQHPPDAPPAEKTVDPAVKALWTSTVVGPLTKAVDAVRGATIQDEDKLLLEAHAHLDTARGNVSTTAAQIKDDPALKGRMELLSTSLLRVANKIVILVNPEGVTFKVVAKTSQHVARDAAKVGAELRPPSQPEATTTSKKTATAILRALWKANVTDKVKPLHGKLVKGAKADAAAALVTAKSASEHVWALVPEYAAYDEPMAAKLARVGHRLGDFENQLTFLAEGTKPALDNLVKDVEGRKGTAENIF
jgi:hypothetical protein